MCAFYFFWLSASHGLRLGMDGMLLALCDDGFERSGLCAVNNNNNKGHQNKTRSNIRLGIQYFWTKSIGLELYMVKKNIKLKLRFGVVVISMKSTSHRCV